MEIPEATKGIGLCGELNKFVPAYGGGFTNLGTSILCQGYVSCYMFFSPLFCEFGGEIASEFGGDKTKVCSNWQLLCCVVVEMNSLSVCLDDMIWAFGFRFGFG